MQVSKLTHQSDHNKFVPTLLSERNHSQAKSLIIPIPSKLINNPPLKRIVFRHVQIDQHKASLNNHHVSIPEEGLQDISDACKLLIIEPVRFQ